MSPSLTDLPNEILLVVLSNCTPIDRLKTLPLVSKRINELCQNPKAWDRVTSLRLGVGPSDILDKTKGLQLSIDSDPDEDAEISDSKFHQVGQVVPLLRNIKTLRLSRGYPELMPALIKNVNLWTNLRYLEIKWVTPDQHKQNILQLLKGVLQEHSGLMQHHVRLSLDLTAVQADIDTAETPTVPWLKLAAKSGLVVDRLRCSGASISYKDEALPVTDLPVKKLIVYHSMMNTDKLLNALQHGFLSHLEINCDYVLFADHNEVSPQELNTFLKAVNPAVCSALRFCWLRVHNLASNEGEYTTYRLLQAAKILLGKAPTLEYLYMKPFSDSLDAPHLEQAPFVHLIGVCMDRAKAQNRGMQVVMENTAQIEDLMITDGESPPVMGAIQKAFPAPDYKIHVEADEESDLDWKLRMEHVKTGRRLDMTCKWSEDDDYTHETLSDHL